MRKRLGRNVAAPALLVLVVAACTANRMYRPHSLEEHSDYSLAFIELDDQGELWAPSQLDRALAHLDKLNESDHGVALVLFVHGWNTDASPRAEKEGKGTLYHYRSLLRRLDEDIRQEAPEMDVPVMGIYLSWRGRVSNIPLIREASFYNRRSTAERIAGASATEAIYRILTRLRENPASRSVLVGHSLGSMILEQALSQAVISALFAAPGGELLFPADLVVLINPAASAIYTKQLIDVLARNRIKTYRFDDQGNRFERPLLVSLTSERDRATRLLFPAGMRLKAINKRFRPYGREFCSPISTQRRLYTHTAGHLTALHSHEVLVDHKGSPPEATPSDRLILKSLHYQETYDPHSQQTAISFDGVEHRFTIRAKPRALNDTPYWIMQVPRELLPGHSAVLTEDMLSLVEAILVLSGTYDASVTTTIEREDGVRPVAVAPREDGTAIFLDRSRGVYAVRPGSPRPAFLSCFRETIDPSNGIGFHAAANIALTAIATPDPGTAKTCKTEVFEFKLEPDGYRLLGRLVIASTKCFAAAAFNVLDKKVYLSHEDQGRSQLLVADLTQDSPRPEGWLDLSGKSPATVLTHDVEGQRLFAARAQTGSIWVVDLAHNPPTPRLLVDDLGWPTALGYGRTERVLYVADAKSQIIWALNCKDACEAPRELIRSPSLENPTTLAVAPDGTLWLGDLRAQTLMAISPEGVVESTIRSLSGASQP